MTLRKAHPNDAPELAAIIGQWFEKTPYLPRLHTTAADQAFVTQLINTQDVLVSGNTTPTGFIARDDTSIGQLYVAEHMRGHGIGGQLLEAMKTRSATLTLWCFQQNEGARRFYEAHRFVAAEMTDGQENEERVPDMRYIWRRPA